MEGLTATAEINTRSGNTAPRNASVQETDRTQNEELRLCVKARYRRALPSRPASDLVC